jgi:hypothetical protein
VQEDTKVIEASLDRRIPEYLEIFECGKYLFLREPAVLKGGTTRCIDLGVEKCESPRTW